MALTVSLPREQVMLCSYMTIHALVLASRNNYSFWPCNAASPNAPPMGELLWMFYMSKVLDFMDTFFIIVKRSWKQLSFLHVYHHFTIFLFYWSVLTPRVLQILQAL